MSRTLQWVLGISAVIVALAVAFALIAPWLVPSWLGRGYSPYGMMGGNGGYGGYGGMMGGYGGQGMTQAPAPWAGVGGQGMMGGRGGFSTGGTRLTIDQARTLAEDYAGSLNRDLTVAEVMEFENNFYAVLEETSTGRGAMEVLIDPYTGTVGPEPGPNMMWNDKYGMMSFGRTADNSLTLDEARGYAQQALEAQLPGSAVHQDGTSFYGYYTFDFDGSDGKIAGMLSVEGTSGSVWLHTWHGDFLQEWEAEAGS